MLIPRFVVGMSSVVAIMFGAGVVCGQGYPNKPIRIVAAPAGGGNDFTARLIAQGLTGAVGQQVIVDNRGDIIAVRAQIVAKAPPDGYTLMAASNSLWLAPFMQDLPYDPVKDFVPVSLTASSPNILVVHPSVAANSVRDLIALARAKPGALNVATGPTGSPNHLAAELFTYMAGIKIVRIAYKGGGPALNALIGGEVQLLFASAGSVLPQLKSGRLRALAVTSTQASALAPELPTMAAAGLPGYQLVGIDCIVTTAGTPAAIVNRLSQEIARVVNRADVKEKFFITGVETVGSSPQELAAFIKSDMATWGKVIKEAGIRSE